MTDELILENIDVFLVNHIGHSWISSIEVFYNDKNVVDHSTQNYAYKSFVENCLSFSKAKKNIEFAGAYWYKDDNNYDK